MSNSYPAVKKVKPTEDYKLILTFSNGETRLFDMKPYLDIGIFRELHNLAMFQTARVSFDTVEWDNSADFDPEVLLKLGKKIKEKKPASRVRPAATVSESKVKYRKK